MALVVLGVRVSPKLCDELVAANLWETADSGWIVHDYLKWNQSRSHVTKRRDDARQRAQRARERACERTSERAGARHAQPVLACALALSERSSERGAGERAQPAEIPNAEAYGEAWRTAAAAAGTDIRLGFTSKEVEHLSTLAGAYSLEDVTAAAGAFWASGHTGGHNLGMFVSQIAEVLGHLKAGHRYPYRGRPPDPAKPRKFDVTAWAAKEA
jgi:hypothetical protein